jgi:hypothetical protein
MRLPQWPLSLRQVDLVGTLPRHVKELPRMRDGVTMVIGYGSTDS